MTEKQAAKISGIRFKVSMSMNIQLRKYMCLFFKQRMIKIHNFHRMSSGNRANVSLLVVELVTSIISYTSQKKDGQIVATNHFVNFFLLNQ